MGQDVQIFVKKKDLCKLYFVTEDIIHNIPQRWQSFLLQLELGSDNDDFAEASYYTAEELLIECAGLKSNKNIIAILRDLVGYECVIKSDYSDFPKDKSDDDYVNLCSAMYDLWVKTYRRSDE